MMMTRKKTKFRKRQKKTRKTKAEKPNMNTKMNKRKTTMTEEDEDKIVLSS